MANSGSKINVSKTPRMGPGGGREIIDFEGRKSSGAISRPPCGLPEPRAEGRKKEGGSIYCLRIKLLRN